MTAMWGGGGLYPTWAAFLDRWAAGEQLDPASLPPLRIEDFAGDTWARLSTRLTDALDRRLAAWAAALTAGIGEARDEFEVARALVNGRLGLAAIRALANHPGLPPEFAAQLLGLVDTQVGSAQRALEAEVERMRRSGVRRDVVEARLRTVRDNPLTEATRERPPASGPDVWYVDPTTPGRRQVIVNPQHPHR